MSIIIPQTNEAINKEDLKDIIDYMFLFFVLKILGNALTFALLIILCIINENLIITIIPSLMTDIIIFIFLLCYQVRYSKYFLTFAIIESVFDTIFKIFLVICIRNGYSTIFTVSIGIIHLFLNFLSCRDQHNSVFLPYLFLTNIIYYLLSLFVILRIENMISWKLYACLWPLYIFLIIIFIMGILKARSFWKSTLLLLKCQKNFGKCKI